MISACRRSRSLAGQRGSVLVTTALVLPALVLMMVFVIDVANAFVHKRHLQVQADSAALAAGGDVRVPCTDAPIIARVNQYAGFASTAGPTFNPQVSGRQPNVTLALNSPTYPSQGSPVDASVRTGGPCSAAMIDVKLTESGLPSLFGLLPISHINAQARVEINKLGTTKHLLPLSVGEARYKRAAITFIDEATGTVLGTRSMASNGVNGAGQTIWDNSASPFPLTLSSAIDRVGVKIAVGTGSSTTCGDATVQCFDKVLFAHGYPGVPAVATGSAPKARDVVLTSGSCSDRFFSSASSSCTVGIQATVDWGTTTPITTYAASMTATLGSGAAIDLTLASANTWTGTMTLPAAAGPQAVTLAWKATKGTIGGTVCGDGTGNGKNKKPDPCTGSLGTVQRSFSASTAASGPIQFAQLWEGAGYGVNSFRQCDSGNSSCTHNLVVKIGLPSNLAAAQSVSDPIYRMRALDGNSQTRALDCDSTIPNLKGELAAGCSAPGYTINTGQVCSGYNNPGSLPDPSPCVVTQTGQSASQIGGGLNQRILGNDKASSCSAPNHWGDFPNLPTGDPRIVYIIITSDTSFQGNGNATFPVQDIAAFYITGWQGNGGFDNPCQKNGVSPADDNAAAGEVVGHFIRYVTALNEGGSTGSPCDLSGTSLGICVSELTR